MAYQRQQVISEQDRLPICVHRWLPARAPRGVVVIAHGAAEHALRYARFAAVLNDAGFSVWAPDHRGHGASPGPLGLGDFGEGGWAALVADLAQVVAVARRETPALPLCLFGHSMGSFAAQELCSAHSLLLEALVLSGSTAISKAPSGPRVSGAGFNAAFEPARTPYDWLSRDPAEVDAYVNDPLCGFESRVDGGARARPDYERLASAELFKGVRGSLPVLLLSGDADPIHRGLAGLRLLEERLRAAGVARIDTLHYPGGRHEMLNELNRDQVMADARDWMLGALGLAQAPAV
jgi:alpha-beta hydrolase superfamily lysophospholipase